MKFVEIYKLQNDGTQQIVCVCKFDGEKVFCEGEGLLVQNLESEGIWDNSVAPRKKVFPKDGMVFLENLRFNFSSGYLNGSEVKES